MYKLPDMAENGTTYRAELIMPYGTGDVVVTPHDYESPLRRGNRLTKAGWRSVLRRIVTDFSNDGVVDRAAGPADSVTPELVEALTVSVPGSVAEKAIA